MPCGFIDDAANGRRCRPRTHHHGGEGDPEPAAPCLPHRFDRARTVLRRSRRDRDSNCSRFAACRYRDRPPCAATSPPSHRRAPRRGRSDTSSQAVIRPGHRRAAPPRNKASTPARSRAEPTGRFRTASPQRPCRGPLPATPFDAVSAPAGSDWPNTVAANNIAGPTPRFTKRNFTPAIAPSRPGTSERSIATPASSACRPDARSTRRIAVGSRSRLVLNVSDRAGFLPSRATGRAASWSIGTAKPIFGRSISARGT